MKVGLFTIGIGAVTTAETIGAAAQAAEDAGFNSLWAPEHIVLLDQYSSKYPYTATGQLPIPTTVDILDPFLALTYAAAVTKRIRVGTGICLVPERSVLETAKEVTTIDRLSNGRFDFGVGIGWLEEEFTALGIPWERRAERTRDYLKAMKVLWTEDEPEYEGEFVRFPKVRLRPQPVQKPHPPIIFGGESAPALRRVGEIGDGWFGVNLTPESAKEAIRRIHEYARAAGRDASKLHIAGGPNIGAQLDGDTMKRFADVGMHELIVGVFPADPKKVGADIRAMAEWSVNVAAKL